MPIQSAAPSALRHRVPRAAWSLLLAAFFAAGALPAAAQPSGGPYGPVAKSYEVPVAANVYYVAPAGDANAPGTTLARPTTIESLAALRPDFAYEEHPGGTNDWIDEEPEVWAEAVARFLEA